MRHESITTAVREHEKLALKELERWDRATDEGVAIFVPRLNSKQEEGDLPAHWYLALAGRHIEKWGEDAQIEWE